MAYFPLFIDLSTISCLVVGGGRVALEKVQKLLMFDANITVIAPEVCDELCAIDELQILTREFQSTDIKGCGLVIAATNDRELNARIANLCHVANTPINVVDDPELCRFIFPSLIRHGELSIGISSGGNSPTAVIDVKERIQEHLPLADQPVLYGTILRQLGSLRETVKQRIFDPAKRAACFKQLYRECIRLERPLKEEEIAEILRG